ncbi:AzlD domain-containing protein [Staphylococcus epidermidis]|nr:AzlD domain-containing protein [Staphylococcus epidermidis]
MTTDLHTLVLIILCGVVTLLIRVIPFVMISRVNLPAIVIKWLSFIPITLFTALIIDGVIQQHDHAFGYTLNLPYIIAIVPTVMLAILAIFTRSLTVTILGGIFVIACLRLIF